MTNLTKPNYNFYKMHETHYNDRLNADVKDNPIWQITKTQENALKAAFNEYEDLFKKNKLNQLKIYNFFNKAEKKDYNKLYRYSLAYFQHIKKEARYLNSDIPVSTCPFCDKNTADTLDHIVPKSETIGFPEFCDNPLNLIPMCSECNKHKSTTFCDENGDLEFINLYIDKLPTNQQYLKVKIQLVITKKNKTLDVSYYIDKNVITDAEIYRKLDNTFNKLGIYEKYKDLAKDSLSVIAQKIIDSKLEGKLSKDELRQQIIGYNNRINHWEELLYREALLKDDIYDFLYTDYFNYHKGK